jgi:hypothetical protein
LLLPPLVANLDRQSAAVPAIGANVPPEPDALGSLKRREDATLHLLPALSVALFAFKTPAE